MNGTRTGDRTGTRTGDRRPVGGTARGGGGTGGTGGRGGGTGGRGGGSGSGDAGRPPVDPRIRARRVATTRSEGRRRLRLVLLALVVVALVAGAWFLLHSRVFSARVVRVVGAVHTPRAEIVSTAGLSGDPPLLDVNPGAAAARLERLPWIATATVSRHWPDGVVVTVTERQPVAVVSTAPAAPPAGSAGGQGQGTTTTTPTTGASGSTSTTVPATTTEPWALVDRSGRVLADVATPPAGLVHLSAPVTVGPPGTSLAAVARPGLRVAATLPPAFSAQVTTVQVGQGGTVTLALTTPVTVALGDTSQLHKKYEDTAAVLAGASLAAGDVIDVQVPDSPTVGPA